MTLLTKIPAPILAGEELARTAAGHAAEKKAERIVVLDLRATDAPADWFVICEGDNAIHNRAVAGAVEDGLRERGIRPWHSEGIDSGRWVVLDYFDVVVHIMLPDLREMYSLEALWKTADR
jgi:ribosome-associated protein